MNKARRAALAKVSIRISQLIESVTDYDGFTRFGKEQIETIRTDLENLKDEEQDAFDNLPEGLQENKQDDLDNCITALETADEILGDAVELSEEDFVLEEFLSGLEQAEEEVGNAQC